MRRILLLISFLMAGPLQAASLQPDELLLIYNADLAASRELANYYAKARRVPIEQMVGVHVDAKEETIAAADFERLIREPVRAFLEERKLQNKVRCLVTFYGIPIRINKIAVTPRQAQLRAEWQRALTAGMDEFARIVTALEGIATSRPTAASQPVTRAGQSMAALLERYGKARMAAFQRIAHEGQTPENTQRYQQFLGIMVAVEGEGGMVAQVNMKGDANGPLGKQLQEMRERSVATDARIKELLGYGPEAPQRNEARQLVRQQNGIVGLLRSLDSDIDRFHVEESEAAVDSELSLLWWNGYPRYRWVTNTLCWRNRANLALRQTLSPVLWEQKVLMTARIDASTVALARRMIDDAIAVERKGLTGRVYIDARGLHKSDGKAEYDQDLIRLAAALQERTKLAVTCDRREELFPRGSCPQAMLYCGWYSLRKYINAFDFVPGAVAWHIASFEAASLKKHGEQGWCTSLLDDGVAATLGPVAEPYLESFPRPTEFFGLLLTGKYSLAECFAYTSPYTSWMTMLLADPLYRPFAKNPVLTPEQTAEAGLVPAPFWPGATTKPASAPATGAK